MPPPPPPTEQSAREVAAGLGQGPRQRHVGGGGGDRAGATNKGTSAHPGPSPPRPGPTEPGRQGALRGAARGQCARGPRAVLTWVRAPRGPLAFPSQYCTRPHARLTCRPPRLPPGPPWLAPAPRRPSPSQTAPPHPRSSPRPPPAPRPPRRTRTAPAELRRPRRPGARRRRTHCAGASERRSLATRAWPGAAHLEGGACSLDLQVRVRKSGAQTPTPLGAEDGAEDKRRVEGAGFYSCMGGRLSGIVLLLCPGTLHLRSPGLASCLGMGHVTLRGAGAFSTLQSSSFGAAGCEPFKNMDGLTELP